MQQLQQIYQQQTNSYDQDLSFANEAYSRDKSYAFSENQMLNDTNNNMFSEGAGIYGGSVAIRHSQRRADKYAALQALYSELASDERSAMSNIRNDQSLLNKAYNKYYTNASSLIGYLGTINTRDPNLTNFEDKSYLDDKNGAKTSELDLGTLSN